MCDLIDVVYMVFSAICLADYGRFDFGTKNDKQFPASAAPLRYDRFGFEPTNDTQVSFASRLSHPIHYFGYFVGYEAFDGGFFQWFVGDDSFFEALGLYLFEALGESGDFSYLSCK